MKISLLKENFYKGVAIASKAVSNKASIPSLSNILIKTEDNQLKLTASDLFVTISVWISAKVEESGATTVPAKLLNSFLSQITEEKIDCHLDADNFNVKTGKVNSTFSTISAEQFPAIEGFDTEEVISIKSEDLLRAMQSLQFVPASTESRPVLTGILFNMSGKVLTLAVTDGFRMAEYKINLEKSVSKEYSFILPARSTIEIIKSFGAESEIIDMSPISSKNAVAFKVEHMEAQLRLIEGEFPNYKAILPSEFATKVIVAKEEIFNAIKLASIFAKDYDNMVKQFNRGCR
jgi:DNA polymerase III subunit beta